MSDYKQPKAYGLRGDLIGRVAMEPEIKYTRTGKAVGTIKIPIDDGYGDRPHTTWWKVTGWGDCGESFNDIHKGDEVVMHGIAKTSEWKTRDGEMRDSAEFTAFGWSFYEGRKGKGADGAESGKMEEPKRESPPPVSSQPDFDDDDIPFS